MTTGMTLDEALRYGQGEERPFRCPDHDDNSASASVNVAKGVWFCFACGSKGRTSGKKAPTVDELLGMLRPETGPRTYPESWLDLYRYKDGNFAERFPDWIRWHAGLGCDPLSGDATFPVRTAAGLLAGVGRRRQDPGDGPRYVYPPRWSAATSLFKPTSTPQEILFLVEGAADATSVAEVGAWVFGLYGAGVHVPQRELIARAAPKLIVLALDNDEAGERAMFGWTTEKGEERAGLIHLLGDLAPMATCRWQAKDPGELIVEDRVQLMAETVGPHGYRRATADWTRHRLALMEQYLTWWEEQAS